MGRYVDAATTAEMISERHNIDLADLVDTFAEIPSADVVEVRHGEWLTDTEKGDKYCSECGTGARWDSIGREFLLTTYCHHCGARMGW